MNTQQWWGCTRMIVRVLWSQGDWEREGQQVAKEGVEDTQQSEEKCTCWPCSSSGENVMEHWPEGARFRVWDHYLPMQNDLRDTRAHHPPCPHLSALPFGFQECFLGTLLLLNVFDIYAFLLKQGAKTGRRWHRGKLQVKFGVQWIKQVKWVVFTFGLCKAFNTHMLIGIGSLIRGK